MSPRITRRNALIGFGALASAPLFKGCGGGGSDTAVGSDVGGGNPSVPSSAPGSIWYADRNGKLVKVSNGGLGTPEAVADIRAADGRVSTFYPRVSRKGPRYLQLGNYGTGSSVGTLLQVYDHADHKAYGFVDVTGYVSYAFVSPSGNYIGMRRSPEFLNDSFTADATSIAGLMIIDISNPNTPRVVRGDYLSGGAAMMQFVWLDGDRFLYVDKNRNIVTGAADSSASSDQSVGKLDTQSLVSREFDVHPDGKSMLVALFSADGQSSDVYLYDMTGQRVAQVTSTEKGYAPVWSPDGSQFMFKWGSSEGSQLGASCTGFYASSSARGLAYANANQFDVLKVNCLRELFWSSIA